jgi:glycosyltransferase involved in cell wall biosynthesis
VPTVVLDGRTGVIVPSEDVELLAAAMVKLLQDSELRASYGAVARKRIEAEFSAERMAGDYLRVYTGVAAGKFGGVKSE